MFIMCSGIKSNHVVVVVDVVVRTEDGRVTIICVQVSEERDRETVIVHNNETSWQTAGGGIENTKETKDN